MLILKENGESMEGKILIIEDDLEISNVISEYLSKNNYELETAKNGLDGMRKIKDGNFDLIVLDLMLPYKSGDEVLREMREFSNIPVIVLSAKDMIHVKVALLHLGADDYITKPFDLNELGARVESNLRRYNMRNNNVQENNKNQILKYKDIELDEEKKKVTANKKEIVLTSKEYEILKLMLTNPEKVFSKANIFEHVWNMEYFGEDNTLNVHMSNIRNKLKKASSDEDYIETVWGMGYRLRK